MKQVKIQKGNDGVFYYSIKGEINTEAFLNLESLFDTLYAYFPPGQSFFLCEMEGKAREFNFAFGNTFSFEI